MTNPPPWLPRIIDLADFDGDWGRMLNAAYEVFCNDFVYGRVSFRGLDVAVRRHPVSNGKEFGFWHCVQEGALEENRTPDMKRLERIGWIRAVIENAHDGQVEQWENSPGPTGVI